jgi:Uncharacterized conserved protein
MNLLVQIVASYISTIAFGVLTNVPRRVLASSGIIGCLGWLIFYYLREAGYSLAIANFFGAVIIGCLSIFFSRKKKIPMIIFHIPSLVPLVPGGPSYKAIRELVLGHNAIAFENMMVVVITAASIAGAFMVSSLIERSILKWKKIQTQRFLKNR